MGSRILPDGIRSEIKEIILECLTETNQDKSKELNKNTEEDNLSQKQAAKFLRITEATLIKWKKEGRVPFYQKQRTVFYRKSELLSAMESKTFNNNQHESIN